MVYECRKRLNCHSRKSDLAQKYLVEKQKTEEKATEFVSRLTALRNKAFGKKDSQGLWGYENAWIHHLEVVLKGFENQQIMAKVNDVNPKTPGELYDTTSHAEETLNRNLRFGYIQGAVDSRALVGLNMPGQNVSQLSQLGVQAMGDSRPPPSRCGKCGNKNHKTAACRYPERVCFWCKKLGHQVTACPSKPANWGTLRTPQANSTTTPRVQEMSANAGHQESNATWVGFQEGSL